MLDFYTQVIGLRLIGRFEGHNQYDGIFLGSESAGWEIEFTVSDEAPGHVADEDDLLVFYLNSEAEVTSVIKRAVNRGITPVKTKNPYWNQHAVLIPDPDGFLVAIGLRSPKLNNRKFSKIAIEHGILDWNALLKHIQSLPYGRNKTREDFSLVLTESKGSCSSKHALLKAIADENGIRAELCVGIYKMHAINTPKIGKTLQNSGLDYVPEAHCYLKFGGHRFDFTNATSDISKIEPEILEEIEIGPDQVVEFKVAYHKDFIKKWIIAEHLSLSFDDVWALRETCIAELSQ